jgi:Domain of unknown function (DUF4832)
MVRKTGLLFSMVTFAALLSLPGTLAAAMKHVAATKERAPYQTFYPTPREGVIRNPGTGYQTFYRSANVDRQLPSSTMYVRFYWSRIETAPGVFDFSIIDQALAQAQAAGQRLAFRIMPYDERDAGPLALRRAGFSGFSFMFDGADVWMPDLDDEQVRQDLQKLITALAARYGSNAAIDSIDLGLIGDWGEQHFWNTRPTPPYPTSPTLKWLSDTFNAHFKVPVLVNDGIWENDPQAFQYAVRAGLGWRVDCWGGDREMTSKYSHVLADVADAWRNAPVILEPCGVMSDWRSAEYPWRASLQWAIDHHVSQISNKSAPIPEEMMEDVRMMLAKIGYRFVLKRASFPAVAEVGKPFPLELDWANEGNAPMYFDRNVVLKLGPLVTKTDISMRGFAPGTCADVTAVQTGRLAAGTYPLEIGLAPPAVESPDISLAILGEGPWYRLGTIALQN